MLRASLSNGNATGQDIFAMRRCLPSYAEVEKIGNSRTRKGPSRRPGRKIESEQIRGSSRHSSYSKRLCLPMDPALTLTGTFAKLNISIKS